NTTPEIIPSGDLSGMDLRYHMDGDIMRVLIYSMDTYHISPGENLLGTINVDGDVSLISTDMADYYGSDLTVNLREVSSLPSEYELSQNFPNPFNPETEIQLSLPEASDWRIEIFNINGRVIETFSGYSEAGKVTVKFQADNLATGMYFYRATAGDFTDTKKMILLK
ncbi:MAG: T9SS type A sorting domain-containing protein, partial [candidate division Zixibacteria bacterium]|nr:T9SS type A sorting domain-containing protein [candidate division Zixibacteria bacterium]